MKLLTRALLVVGVLLLGLNVAGLFMSLRGPGLGEDGFLPPRSRITLDYSEALVEIERRPSELDADYVRRLNTVVHRAMAQFWPERDLERYRIRVPIWENYLIYVGRYVAPAYFPDRYEFCDYRKALERGVGLCSQHAIVMTEILRERGIRADIVHLEGHVVAQADVGDSSWIADADYGVVVPHDIRTIEASPSLVAPYYEHAGYAPETVRELVRIYGREDNYVYEGGAPSYLPRRYRLERATYVLIWVIPALAVLPYAAGRIRRRTSRRPTARTNGAVRICYVIGTLDIGGAEKHLVEVVKRLDRERFAPQVVAISKGGPLQAEIEAAGVPVWVVGFGGLRHRFDLASYAKLASAFTRLTTFMRRERFDIVHAYLFWAYILATPAARLAGVPWVIQGRRFVGQFKAAKPHYLWLERRMNRMVDRFVPNSEGVKADAARQEGLADEKLRVIYNGVDNSKYQIEIDREAKRRELGLSASGPVVTVVANLHHYKGHRFLLDALPDVVARHPDLAVLFVGEGHERGAIAQRIGELDLSRHVLLLGQRRDIPEILAVTDVFVLPSLQEGFANVILEAMAAGRAIVVTTAAGSAEAIEDGASGLLVPVADASALGEALLALLADPAERRRLGEGARRRAEEKFSARAMVEEMTDMYLSLIATRRRPRSGTGRMSAG